MDTAWLPGAGGMGCAQWLRRLRVGSISRFRDAARTPAEPASEFATGIKVGEGRRHSRKGGTLPMIRRSPFGRLHQIRG
jgi:hypothetical protein